MAEFDFSFEDVGLALGKDTTGKRQTIALITGSARIETQGRGRDTEWQILSVELESPVGPLDKHTGATIGPLHPLINFIIESIEYDCGDRIWDEALEAQRPDPAALHDAMADAEFDRQHNELSEAS